MNLHFNSELALSMSPVLLLWGSGNEMRSTEVMTRCRQGVVRPSYDLHWMSDYCLYSKPFAFNINYLFYLDRFQ